METGALLKWMEGLQQQQQQQFQREQQQEFLKQQSELRLIPMQVSESLSSPRIGGGVLTHVGPADDPEAFLATFEWVAETYQWLEDVGCEGGPAVN